MIGFAQGARSWDHRSIFLNPRELPLNSAPFAFALLLLALPLFGLAFTGFICHSVLLVQTNSQRRRRKPPVPEFIVVS
jgi:hypothetical protein